MSGGDVAVIAIVAVLALVIIAISAEAEGEHISRIIRELRRKP